MFNLKSNNLKKILIVFFVFTFLYLSGAAYYHTHKDLPVGIDFLSEEYPAGEDDVRFLYDLTYVNGEGEAVREQMIFDEIFSYIDKAEKYILIDMFLFNDYGAKTDDTYRALAFELTEKLISKKNDFPDIKIDFITDPINTVYGGGESSQIEDLKRAGVNVVITDLSALWDSNYLYSAVWRTFFKFAGNSSGGFLKHPFSSTEDKVSIRSYLSLLNFKANHRKAFAADNQDDYISIITSANPHDGSSAHSNVALAVKGEVAQALYSNESEIAKMSGGELSDFPGIKTASSAADNIIDDAIKLRLASERKIKEIILSEIKRANQEFEIRIAQFYMADRDIVKALIDAAGRKAAIRIILDPNKDAFGYEKNGIPNRQVADELVRKSDGEIKIRWYDTHGEQFHTKMFVSEHKGTLKLLLGSANLTRRNLDNFNLELDILAEMPRDSAVAEEVIAYFERIWNNDGAAFTLDYEKYQSSSKFKTLIYRIQEGLGLSSF